MTPIHVNVSCKVDSKLCIETTDHLRHHENIQMNNGQHDPLSGTAERCCRAQEQNLQLFWNFRQEILHPMKQHIQIFYVFLIIKVWANFSTIFFLQLISA